MKIKLPKVIHHVLCHIYPFIFFVNYAFISIETYTYLGALRKYLLIDSRIFLILTVVLSLYLIASGTKTFFHSPYLQTTLRLNLLLLPPVLIGYYFLLILEGLHYPNYVFTTYHLQPENIIYLVYLNFVGIFFQLLISYGILPLSHLSMKIQESKEEILRFPRASLILGLSLFLILGYYILDNSTRTFRNLISTTTFIVSHPNLTDSEKNTKNWGFLYTYLQFIITYTPKNAVIAFPPAQDHWLFTGNSVLMRYFLYPRTVLSVKETNNPETLYELSPKSYDYVAVIRGEWQDKDDGLYGWPKVKIHAKHTIYLNEKNQQVIDQPGDFDPNNTLTDWGLIEVVHD